MLKKILLVDDSATQRLASRMLFDNRKERYQFISASDGKEGVEVALKELPDLIFMDIEMPRLGGLDACRLLKENEATRTIPIILLTMRDDEADIEQGYACGCSDFLVKPLNEQKVSATLKSHFGE